MESLRAPWFSLRHSLESGQYFRWRAGGDGFECVLRGRPVRLRQDGETLRFDGTDAATLRRFFSLDHDLPGIHARLARDPLLREPLERYRGLRIIRQEPWECVVAFITSAASNIPRITRHVVDMAARFGDSPAGMGTEEELRDLKLGFRAKYLAQSARLARDGRLDRLGGSTEELCASLMEFPGIGRKVAECVALFAYGRLDAFPVDTWIRKAMRRLYFRNRKVNDRRIAEFAARRFGPLAGYAQQYLFVGERERGARPKSNVQRPKSEEVLSR